MDPAHEGLTLPRLDALRQTLADQQAHLGGPGIPEVVQVRVDRVLQATGDVLDLSPNAGGRETATRTLAWLAESIGALTRLPDHFAVAHAAPGQLSPVLTLVDELDLLGLTLDHTYDALAREDEPALQRQLTVLVESFATRNEPTDLVLVEDGHATPAAEIAVDEHLVQQAGLEVGADGIPRLPIPASAGAPQPAPHRSRP